MSDAVELFGWFEREAAEALGAYTSGVAAFLATEHAHRGIREDQIFCGRLPVEYHLAMVATEIMNRGLRERFEQMGHEGGSGAGVHESEKCGQLPGAGCGRGYCVRGV